MSQVRMMQTSPGRALDDHAERQQPAVEQVVVGGQPLPRGPDHEPPKEKLERQRQDKPEDAHAEQLRGSRGTDPPDAHQGDSEDYQRPGEDADLARSKFANERRQKNASGDAVQDFGGDRDEPDGEGAGSIGGLGQGVVEAASGLPD